MLRPEESSPEGQRNMDKHVSALLSALRQAVNEAILGSRDVNAALAAISRTGRCPSLSVDVALETLALEEREDESPDHWQGHTDDPGGVQSLQPGELVLTGIDEEFLQSLGISVFPKVTTSSGR
jgi:hypothetical protein